MSESFSLPLVAGGAVDQPYGLMQEILLLRSYASAKRQLDDAKTLDTTPKGPTVDLVWEIMGEIWYEDRDEPIPDEDGP